MLFILVQFLAFLPFAAAANDSKVDPFMGDWQGEWTLSDGYDYGQLVAQVVALGNNEYSAKLIEGFDMTVDPYGTLNGQRKGQSVIFSGKVSTPDVDLNVKAVIEGDKFKGAFEGQTPDGTHVTGTFDLKSIVRLSPTLGAKPPKGAVVLFNGTNFDQWENLGGFSGIINIAEILGSSDNSVAYLRGGILSETQQDATLEVGSDDGIKVWLNGEVVHANNASRGVSPGQDKIKVTLNQGYNRLLLKVNNGGGDWGACARLVSTDNKPLRNIQETISREERTDKYLKANGGYLTVWRVAGPFKEDGKDGPGLFDVVFPPEESGRRGDIEWKRTSPDGDDPKAVKWTLVNGAMQCKPGSGSIVTKKKFNDFKLHIEFRSPFMPTARGQGRGNSGVYLQGRYEVQVLDSYGLERLDNECGGIYQIGTPAVNMCAPPMQWQTYDITFRAPRFEGGDKKENAVVTVRHNHNDIVIHDELPIPRVTGGALDSNEGQPGAIYLQDHGNTVQFRNIWLVELK